MFTHSHDSASLGEVTVVPEVIEYINKRDCDFRICTSCGGPILLPIRVKPPKKTDLLLKAGNHTIYVSSPPGTVSQQYSYGHDPVL